MIIALAISALAATATPSIQPAVSKQAAPRVELVAADASGTEKISFVEAYFPFTLTDELHPEVDDKLVVAWILTALLAPCASPVWMPFALGIDVPNDYFVDGLIIWLVHIGFDVVVNVMASAVSVGLGFIPFVGGFVGPAVWGVQAAATVVTFVDWIYLTPVATINLMSRKAKEVKGGVAAREESNKIPGPKPGATTVAFAY